MKTSLNLLLALFLLCRSGHAQGYIVPNGITDRGFIFGWQEFDVIQNPTNGDYTGFLLFPKSSNTFGIGTFADEGVRTFLVSSNDPISLQPILSQSYQELTGSHVFANGVSFYLGFYTGYDPWVVTNIDGHATSFYTGIYSRSVFGWGEFINNQGSIQLLDSGLEIEGGGIYAGTLNIIQSVPEPRALVLIAFSALLLACRRWKNTAARKT